MHTIILTLIILFLGNWEEKQTLMNIATDSHVSFTRKFSMPHTVVEHGNEPSKKSARIIPDTKYPDHPPCLENSRYVFYQITSHLRTSLEQKVTVLTLILWPWQSGFMTLRVGIWRSWYFKVLVLYLDMVCIVPADALAPDGARTSAATMMTT